MRGAYLIATSLLWSVLVGVSANAQDIPAGAEPGRIESRFEERAPINVAPTETTGLESTIPPAEAATVRLRVLSVSVTGSSVFSAEELSDITDRLSGETVSLAEVFGVAAAITARYGQEGYILSRAIVPPQALEPGGANITIRVIEGYVDAVQWPEFIRPYRDLFTEYSAKITADRPLNIKTLERYLLLANDLAGLSFETNLTPSEVTPGASTLVITGGEKRVDGFLSADNYGVEASGPYQLTLGGGVNNTLRIHERIEGAFSLAGPSPDDRRELAYLSLGYEQTLTSEGLTFFIAGNASWGEPATPALVAFDTETRGINVSAGLRFPILRSRSQNLIGTIAFDYKDSRSENLGVTATEDRLRIAHGELDYAFADDFGGRNRVIAGAAIGINGLGSTDNDNPLASRAGGRVDFFKITAEASRTQKLGRRFEVYGSVFGQWTDDALLSSQECGYGGRQFGRGFDASIITGDRCLLLNAEARFNAPIPEVLQSAFSSMQPYAFVDYGAVTNVNAPLGTPTDDEGASIGAGLRFGGDFFDADFAVSHIIHEPTSQTGLTSTRAWFKTTLKF